MLLMLLLFSLYLTNYASEWLWNFPPFTYILYPFRFLFVASFFGAHLSGVVVGRVSSGSYVRRMGGWLLALILIAAALVQGRPYTNPYVEIFPFPESYFKQRQTVTFAPFTRKNMLIKEFLPTRASLQFLATEEKQYLEAYFKGEAIESKDVSISKGEGVIERIKIGVEKVSGALEAKTPVTVLFHRFFFPNWEVFVDGVKYPLSADEVGRIMVEVPAGKHQLQLVFGTTKIEKIANIVSLVGGLIFGLEVAFIISRRVRRVNSIKYQV